jgi:hypothetical protein
MSNKKTTTVDRRHRIFQATAVYPRTDHLMLGAEKESPVATLSFACGSKDDDATATDATASCDMSALAACVAGHPDLIAWSANYLAAEVVDDIARHQDHYTPQRLDGFVIARNGQYLVHLKKEGAAAKGRTGFIDIGAACGNLENRNEKAATFAAGKQVFFSKE